MTLFFRYGDVVEVNVRHKIIVNGWS